jgi:hypothetical protein
MVGSLKRKCQTLDRVNAEIQIKYKSSIFFFAKCTSKKTWLSLGDKGDSGFEDKIVSTRFHLFISLKCQKEDFFRSALKFLFFFEVDLLGSIVAGRKFLSFQNWFLPE